MGTGTGQGVRAEGKHRLDLLVISDLHLSAGRDPGTGRISPKEDFLADAQLRRFLEHHQRGERRWHLIINGDFLDFLQVKESGARAAAAPRGLATLAPAAPAAWPPRSPSSAHRRAAGPCAGPATPR